MLGDARRVPSGHHLQLAHHRARSVRKVLTPLQLGHHALLALLGHLHLRLE